MHPSKLFDFTEEEEALMKRSIRAAAAFIAGYGKGRMPSSIGVGISHYAQNDTEALAAEAEAECAENSKRREK